jgi:hydrogenase large subunit
LANAKIKIDPVNRMEGHLGIDCETKPAESNGVRVIPQGDPLKPIGGASLHGNLFRGFEQIMINRDPRDAVVLTQRI